ncbi:MAG: alkaline phosphatase [Rhodothermaceae bacterium]|nr:MAG: alkaline phosphatase [Rhodothermaceae bacterium]
MSRYLSRAAGWLVLLLMPALAACSSTSTTAPPPAEPRAEVRPKNVILFISDGCGPASFTMARAYRRDVLGRDEGLALDPFLVGTVQTHAADTRVTDSAAGATAFACGVKTYNGAIAVDTLRQPLGTLVEAAEARGLATGLVATSTITHATPAAFSAHVPARGMTAEIAAQQITRGIDVLFGGGLRDYLPVAEGGSRQDGRNLLEEARAAGYTVATTRDAFDRLDAAPALALMAPGHMAYELDRNGAEQPSLAEMTRKALDLLAGDPDGFFLMVEGSRIDHAAHGNDAAGHLHDILAYDEAVAVALAFAREEGHTLVVATSDHETGGLTLGRSLDGRGVYAWYPEVLAGVRRSNEGLAKMLEAGADPAAVLRTGGLDPDDLDAADRQALLDAAEEGDTGAFLARYNDVIARRAVIGWTTTGHTGVDVNLYAFGPGADRFRGNQDNTDVGRRLADLLGLDLPAATKALRTSAATR